ncbi:MAG: EamA family transporter [Elusimicrobiaceae bacterium]|jgi:drug/metabolite transporter (DMT)-like permease
MKNLPQNTGLFYCSFIWGSTFFLIKDTLALVHPVPMVAYRFIIAAIVLAPFVFRKRVPGKHLKESAVLSAMLVILYVSQTWGMRYTSAANSGFITGLFVFFVPLFAFLIFKREIRHSQWAACGVALCGLWILTGGISGFNIGDAMTLFSAASYGMHVVYMDRCVKAGADITVLTFQQFWMTAAACLLLSFACGFPLGVSAPLKGGVILAFLALFPTLSGFFVQAWAQKKVSPVRASLIFAFEPVFAALFAWTLGGEKATLGAIAGGALIVSSLFISEISSFGGSKELLRQ